MLSFVLGTALFALTQGQIAISEFQAVNDTSIEDEDGDRSDWIELTNLGGQTVDLGGWALSDDPTLAAHWVFPAGTLLGPSQFLVVFASDKGRAVAGAELHLDFKLSGKGETLALLRPDGSVAQDFGAGFPEQFGDVSYGFEELSGMGPVLGYMSSPTPGTFNRGVGPPVVEVEHKPVTPTPGEDVIVMAEMAPSVPPVAVDLIVRRMFQTEFRIAMRDDGGGNDRVAADGTWTATIPAGTATAGEMLRWAVESDDGQGGLFRAPGNPMPVEAPEYFGTMVQDSALASELEIYHWFVEDPSAATTGAGTRCSLWYEGEFYDNLFVRRRGGSSAWWPKRSFKFDFNRGHHFRYDPDRRRVEELNLNTSWSDKSYLRRYLGWKAYEAAGQPGSDVQLVHLRMNNEFYSVTAFVEQPDENLLDRFGWDEDGVGPLYKMYNVLDRSSSGVEKKTRRSENNSDLKGLVQGLKLTGIDQRNYIFDNVDLPAVINYIAITNLIHNNDHIAKNYYVYRDVQTDDEWRFIPWDLDLTQGRNYTRSGGVLNDTIWADLDQFSHPLFGDRDRPKNDGPWNRLIDAVFQHPESRELYMRRFRTVMDQLLQSPGTPRAERWFESQFDDWAPRMSSDVALDVARWGIPSYGDRNQDYLQALQIFEAEFLEKRRVYLYETLGLNGTGEVPDPQPRVPRIGFASWDHDPASGNAAEEYLEVSNLESTPIDLSDWTLSGDYTFTFEPGTVIGVGRSLFVSPDLRAFRMRSISPTGGEARLVVGPATGDLRAQLALELRDDEGFLVAHTGAPVLVTRDFKAGARASVTLLGGTPDNPLGLAYSLTGPGPTSTPYGLVSLSLPIRQLPPLNADAFGGAVWQANLPTTASGMPIWLQGYDVASSTLTPGNALVID
ncbi:MAG: CotH kinase family protein [Planctomycetes bacterium]|nr:CotH kinase family protein [Planctomycetota bacterium]